MKNPKTYFPSDQIILGLARRLFNNAELKNIFLIFALVSVGLFLVSWTSGFYEDGQWFENVLVEAHGMWFDILILGIFATVLSSLSERKREIQRYNEEIEDFLGWKSDEAACRITGNIRRLNKLGARPAKLYNAYLENVNLDKANISNADLNNTSFVRASMVGITLERSNLTQANLANVDLSKARLIEANLENAYLENANLTGANLQGAKLNGAHLQGVNLKKTELRGADLRGSIGIQSGDREVFRQRGALRLASI